MLSFSTFHSYPVLQLKIVLVLLNQLRIFNSLDKYSKYINGEPLCAKHCSRGWDTKLLSSWNVYSIERRQIINNQLKQQYDEWW